MPISTVLLFTTILSAQSTPVDIPKADLPKSAHCVVCESDGQNHGMEKPAAGVLYQGKTYYFCNVKEVASFRKDPEAYMPPVLPRAMPAFDLNDLSGKRWNSAEFKGKTVLVDFWATWCVPCREVKPIVEKVRAKYAAKGFNVLSVSIDEKRTALDQFLVKNKFAGPVLHDTSQTWATWGVKSIPALFLVRDGQIVAQWRGKQTEKTLSAAVEKAL